MKGWYDMKKGAIRFVFTLVLTVLAAGMVFTSVFAGEEVTAAKDAALAWLQGAVGRQCPPATFETDDPLIAVSSYTYENAVTALALMAEGDMDGAKKILDAFVQGMQNDTEFSDRFRNAYMAGNAATVPGYWNNAAGQWVQDAYQVGSSTKSSAAAAVALMSYYLSDPVEDYLNTAVKGINWVLGYCADANPGFTAGYNGWPKAEAETKLTYKAAVDNLWMYAACRMLADQTGWNVYAEAADSAYSFLTEAMYSAGDSRFFQGTAEDGVTPVANLIMVDVQALAALCLDNDAGMDNIGLARAADGGYAYDNSATNGSWLEGSAMAALALKQTGNEEAADAVLSAIQQFRLPSGSFPQASIAELRTGELNRTINNWPTLGAAAWFILAADNYDPFAPIK